MNPRLAWAAAAPRGRAYLELTKPRVVALMLFTAFVGMVLAPHDGPPWAALIFGSAGIALMAASGAAANHLIDARVDALMARTRARPLPQGLLKPAEVAGFVAGSGVTGFALLLAYTNALCAGLTLASLLGYAVVYSIVLKPRTPQNIVIGGAAGATPPLLGWVAVTGQIDASALALVLIIFIWTPAHFWALAIHRRSEYERAGIPMLPVTHGVAYTAARIVGYTQLLWVASLLPWATDLGGGFYLACAIGLGARFMQLALRLQNDGERWAMPTFRYSIVYLAGLYAALLIDHWLARG